MTIKYLAVIALIFAGPAHAQAPVKVPAGVTPCAVLKTNDAEAAKREIRRLKRLGYRITVQRGAALKVVREGGDIIFPFSLSRARIAVSGC